MRYRRARSKGGSYFFTVVTFKRAKILSREDNVQLLRSSIRRVLNAHPFRIDAFVLLPDHLHCIWTLPAGDADFSLRWRLIKSDFTRKCHDRLTHAPLDSRKRKKERAVWQRRFWEHRIRDEIDFVRHADYIHYNPVHHNYVTAPKDWPFSSFHRFVRHGRYSPAWGAGEDWKPTEMESLVGWGE
jgi:putative transposase